MATLRVRQCHLQIVSDGKLSNLTTYINNFSYSIQAIVRIHVEDYWNNNLMMKNSAAYL